MNTVDDLISVFNAGKSITEDGEESTFFGTLFGQKDHFKNFLNIRNFSLSIEMRKFIEAFSGTTLFKDKFGIGFIMFPLEEIENTNLDLQKTTGIFFPKYVLIAEDFRGDLIAIRHGREFGWLDHEAFAEVDNWDTEAFKHCNFNEWMDNFIRKGGETIL